MRRLWAWLAVMLEWLTLAQPHPRSQPVRGGSRDRSLRGKDRRRARRLA